MLTLWGNLGRNNVLDREFNRFFGDFAAPVREWEWSAVAPAADISETNEAVRLKIDLPGVDPKEIQVRVENDVLTIRAERKAEAEQKGESYHRRERTFGVMTRSFDLPTTVDASRCDAHYDAGVLTIELPKREEAKRRTIDVKVR